MFPCKGHRDHIRMVAKSLLCLADSKVGFLAPRWWHSFALNSLTHPHGAELREVSLCALTVRSGMQSGYICGIPNYEVLWLASWTQPGLVCYISHCAGGSTTFPKQLHAQHSSSSSWHQHLSWALGNPLPFGKDSPSLTPFQVPCICEVTIPSVFQGLALCSNLLRSQNPYQLFVFWQSRILDSLDQFPRTTALRPQGSTKNWNTKTPKEPEMLWLLSNAQVQKHVFASLPRNW